MADVESAPQLLLDETLAEIADVMEECVENLNDEEEGEE